MLLFSQLNRQLNENNVMAKANKLGQRKDSSKIKDEELVITLIYIENAQLHEEREAMN